MRNEYKTTIKDTDGKLCRLISAEIDNVFEIEIIQTNFSFRLNAR